MRKEDAARVLRNLAIMLERRGLVDDAERVAKQLVSSYNVVENTAHVEDQIRVKLHFDTIRTMGRIQDVIHYIQSAMPTKCFLVVKRIASRPFKELIAMENVEIFWIAELVNDLASNELISKHVRTTEEERQKLLWEFKITTKQLPKMDKTDFMARYMGFRVGDVIKIIRPSPSAGESVSYRVVVNASWDRLDFSA